MPTMNRPKLSAASKSKSSDEENTNQASDPSKDVVPRRRINVKTIQNMLVIWLDNNIDDDSPAYRDTVARLRRIVNTVHTFTNEEECIDFIENITDNKASMITSGSVGQHIVPRIHNMSQINSIFIFCSNKEYHEKWAKEWSKIKGVFTKIGPIYDALKQAAHECEQNAISISFMATSGNISKTKLDQLDSSYIYTQVLKEILLSIEFEQKHIQDFIDHCRVMLAENEGELDNVKKFEQKYRDETSIRWYTSECFVYPMLNRALRITDVDIIMKMGFFIKDLHRHIERLYLKEFKAHHSDKSFIVYRGQGISKTHFEQMTKIKGGLMSFNSFLTTSKERSASLDFACHALSDSDMVGILFIMTITPSKPTTPFASIMNVSGYQNAKDEILFSMHTIFRINDIKPLDENERLFQVDLTLTGDNDEDLRILTDLIRKETFPEEKGWLRIGLLLCKMGQYEKSQQVYELLLEQTTNDSEKDYIYERLGTVKYEQGEYKEAMTFYEKALEIEQQSLPPNHPHLALSYDNIGLVYRSMNEYPQALSYHEKALQIQQNSLSPNHPDLGSSYNNIGLVYDNMGEYSKALSSHKKAVEIRQQSLAANHPDLAASYKNIGNVYYKMGDYSQALLSYEKAFEIKEQSLPLNHPDLGGLYNNIGLVYEHMDECSKAQLCYERAVSIGQQSLSSNHPRLQSWKRNLDDVKKKLHSVF